MASCSDEGNRGEQLIEAAAHGDNLAVRRWVGEVDVDFRDSMRRTALHAASEHGETATVQLLHGLGADVNVPDTYNNSPLHVASRNGHTSTVQLLLTLGADPNAITDKRYSVLEITLTEDVKTEVLTVLLAGGADVPNPTTVDSAKLRFYARHVQELQMLSKEVDEIVESHRVFRSLILPAMTIQPKPRSRRSRRLNPEAELQLGPCFLNRLARLGHARKAIASYADIAVGVELRRLREARPRLLGLLARVST